MIKEFLKSFTAEVLEESLLASLDKQRAHMEVIVEEAEFDQLYKWSTTIDGDLVHESGKFFRICGAQAINLKTGKQRWQPIIDQPEQGILGITSRCKNGKIEILLQAKIEPGNRDRVQYSPTVQATKSNYTGVHKGKGVPYVDDYMPESKKVKSRGFQSEHGYKFYKKANDNIHVRDNTALALDERFVWLSLNDVRFLLGREHCINMDTRSVLGTIDFIGRPLTYNEVFSHIGDNQSLEVDLLFSSLTVDGAVNTSDEIATWLLNSKATPSIEHKIVPLKVLRHLGWTRTKNKICSATNKHFEVVGIKATIESREVSSWYQPIIRDNVPKIYAFLMKKINNTVQVLVQMVEEDFSWSGPELGPTFHSVQSDKELGEKLNTLNLSANACQFIYDKYQSEEGGRFLQQQNRYMLIKIDDTVEIPEAKNYKWMTLYQLKSATSTECSVNIEARTLLAIASYYKDEGKQ